MSRADEPRVTKWTSCHVPEGDPDWYSFALDAEYVGKGKWAIRRLGQCMSRRGEWDYEPQPSSRTDAWLAANRFTEAEAKGLIAALAETVEVNGVTAAEWVERARTPDKRTSPDDPDA